MPLKVEIDRFYLDRALDLAIGSLTRAANAKNVNPLIKQIYEADLKIYTDAKNTITVIK